jgi:diadenosine tetraphosphate (Ap4A) HIT family hydrolase
MELLAEAVERACARRDPAFRRVNLEILGNTDPCLHAHVWARYEWEPTELVNGLVWRYLASYWNDPTATLGPQHDDLRATLTTEIDHLRSVR